MLWRPNAPTGPGAGGHDVECIDHGDQCAVTHIKYIKMHLKYGVPHAAVPALLANRLWQVARVWLYPVLDLLYCPQVNS